jgi:hypothetical protein
MKIFLMCVRSNVDGTSEWKIHIDIYGITHRWGEAEKIEMKWM